MANPPKPTALKVLQGNPGKRRLNAREPQPTVLADAEPPEWLEDAAKEAWRAVVPKLCALRLVTEADLQGLTMLFDAYAEWFTARKTIREKGMTFEVWERHDGERYLASVRRRPEAAIAADAFRRVRLLMSDFGMTPAARVRLVTADDDGSEADPFDSWMRQQS
jgi:P27 family predicted phage terminase small subunit